ncbi:hypothetical protein DTO271D3_4136 [Paecilomyces variotii]|nr:hypothetical protein DTO271D3_4136 [Paecilomyces variotii]
MNICHEFARSGTCRFKKCKYLHEKSSGVPQNINKKEQPKSKSAILSDSEKELRAWQRNIPRDTESVRPLRGKLATFFQEARRLIEIDVGSLQSVIKCLSQEGGLWRVCELIDQDFDVMLIPSRKEEVFKTQILPFFEIVSHPNVLSSLIIEQSLGTIYNFLYGNEGTRASTLFKYVGDVLANATVDEDYVARFEVSVHVFSLIVDLNSTALIHENLKTQATRFEEILLSLNQSTRSLNLHYATVYLKRLLDRFGIGTRLPSALAADEGNKNQRQKGNKKVPSFILQREPPGGRHDNDHMDICDIRILPSYQEISSTRQEYLPITDPSQWHVDGVDGLLDRNFRLLREDTVGQLRDAIHQEIHRPLHTTKIQRKTQQRTYVYHDARINQFSWDQISGLRFQVVFPQPVNVRNLPQRELEAWWKMSKRLQYGALVCLMLKDQFIVFCTVTESRGSAPHNGTQKTQTQEQTVSTILWNNVPMASVMLELVDKRANIFQAILDQYTSTAPPFALVEFPGVLLPAFEPTLRALQIYPDQPADTSYLQQHSSLDDSQAAALVSSLQRRIGLIQGPPGTGKSYTGVALIKTLLANRHGGTHLGPIICVTYTNHALDQLLEALIDKGVTSNIVRIGSQSKSERLAKYNIRTISRGVERTRMEKAQQWDLHRKLEEIEEDFNRLRLKKKISGARLKYHLHNEHSYHYRNLFGLDEDGFREARNDENPGANINKWLHGGARGSPIIRPLEQLESLNLFHISRDERQALYNHWIGEIRENLHDQVVQLSSDHCNAKAEFDGVRDELNLRCLNQADIIGLTTTGLARNMNMLRRLQSKVMLCEEAGEVLEAHLLTALLPSIEHLILIGDHLQLPPKAQNYDLSRENPHEGEQYSLDVSLFERLVMPTDVMGSGLPFSTLETQRRMHPSIAQLIRDTLYPKLSDAPSVSEYPEVIGVKKRLFWLDHRNLEMDASNIDAMATSHWNQYEIDMTTGLVNHLIRQGTYKSTDIAVLTPYLGQLHRLRQRLGQSFAITLGERDQDELEKSGFEGENSAAAPAMRTTLLQALRIATVDNFQGEEAKVVVITLVRSNPQNRCGFLRTSNRINVLLSRAQHGIVLDTQKHQFPYLAQMIFHEFHPREVVTFDVFTVCHVVMPVCKSAILTFCTMRSTVWSPANDHLRDVLMGVPRSVVILAHRSAQSMSSKKTEYSDAVTQCRTRHVGKARTCLPCVAQCLSRKRYLLAIILPVFLATLMSHHLDIPAKCNVVSYCHVATVARTDVWTALPRTQLVMFRLTMASANTNVVEINPHVHMCVLHHATVIAHALLANYHAMYTAAIPSVCESAMNHVLLVPKKGAFLPAHTARARCLVPHPVITFRARVDVRNYLHVGINVHLFAGKPVVDFILGETYKEINLDENPCIFPKCGHFLTMENMDALMELRRHYKVDADGKPIAISSTSDPFSIEDIKRCAHCRGPLRDIARYGRLVRRALLDESTKKLIVSMNREYVPLAQEVSQQIQLLQDTNIGERKLPWPKSIQIRGTRSEQCKKMRQIMNQLVPGRWKAILDIRGRIHDYCNRVALEEQPLIRVYNMVEYARRRNITSRSFEFDNNMLQTKGLLQGTALSLRVDISLLSDLLTLKQRTSGANDQTKVEISLEEPMAECRNLIHTAENSQRVPQQVEGHIFLAQLHALERSHATSAAAGEEQFKHCRAALDQARLLCDSHPGQAQGLSEEVEGVEKMLTGSTFYTTVTSEERMAVVQAMAREFSGTGHWYYCRNGHPFTIGECGAAMQRAACPECGAPVGGQHHQAAEGVTHASDMEREFARMNL